MQCATCGNPVPAGAAFCNRCGAMLTRPPAQYPPAHHAVPAAPGTAPCPRCRAVIPLTSQTCPACALPLAQPQLAPRPNTVPCPRCKAQVIVGSRSCQSCGFTPGLPPARPPGAQASGGLVAGFWHQVDSYASLDKLEGFSLKEMFSEVFRKRQQDEIDDYFQVGSRATTPDIAEVQTGWPKPWFFGRVLLFVSALYFGQYIAFEQFQNTLMLPGMMMTGALAMPFATAILFFELNTPRNVAFHRVLSLVCMGGVLSIFISLIGFQVSQLHAVLGAPAAGIVEEIGKLLTVILMARKIDKPYILNGCLFGAAVGAGFAAFESAGYAFNVFLSMLPDKSQAGILYAAGGMVSSITLRGILAPFGHVAWTGIAAGLLWRARAQTPSFDKAVFEKRFLRGFLLVMTMHALWNFTAGFGLIIALPFMALIGAVSWYVVFGIVQQGLRQVRGAQKMTHTAQIRAFGPSAAQG